MFQPLSRAEASLIRGLQRRKEREAQHLFLAEGIRVAEELLDSGLELHLVVVAPPLATGERGITLLERLRERATIKQTDERTLATLAGTQTPQGLLVVARVPRATLAELKLPPAATILVLDGVQDPGNFGTLVRTADALGAAAVVTLPGTVDPWNGKSVRAAAGAAFRIPIVETELGPLSAWLEEQGCTSYGAEAGGADASQVTIARRAALFVGNEGAGLSTPVRDTVETLLAVPIEGHAESLNVAVAAGILLFLLTRRR
jgi:TrmH family RNA methyltransferase